MKATMKQRTQTRVYSCMRESHYLFKTSVCMFTCCWKMMNCKETRRNEEEMDRRQARRSDGWMAPKQNKAKKHTETQTVTRFDMSRYKGHKDNNQACIKKQRRSFFVTHTSKVRLFFNEKEKSLSAPGHCGMNTQDRLDFLLSLTAQ